MSQLYESCNDLFSLLPVKIYRHTDLVGDALYVPLHWHRSIEITITLTGRIRFNTGNNNFDFGESDWIIVNSCELHSCRYINPTDHFFGISIIVSLPFVEKWLGKNLFFYNPENPVLTQTLKTIASEIYYTPDDVPHCELNLMSKVYQILYLIADNCIRPEQKHTMSFVKDSHIAIEFTDYIEQHYQDVLTLDTIAEHFKYSSGYFSRLFKEVLGVSFHSYLNFVRVTHAAEQMSHSPVNLTELAVNNGFPNVKSFINTFKKLYGCTPGNYLSSI